MEVYRWSAASLMEFTAFIVRRDKCADKRSWNRILLCSVVYRYWGSQRLPGYTSRRPHTQPPFSGSSTRLLLPHLRLHLPPSHPRLHLSLSPLSCDTTLISFRLQSHTVCPGMRALGAPPYLTRHPTASPRLIHVPPGSSLSLLSDISRQILKQT